jgi:biotin carboxyl carrier protein
MELELKVNDRTAIVKELKREGNIRTIAVDDEIYEVDVVKVREQEYSVLHQGKSHNIEVIENAEPKHYSINTFYSKFDIEVVDNESRYMQFRTHGGHNSEDNIIKSPMPGKVVKVLVKAGDKVEAGQTVIILSAMKMESEFKSGKNGIVTEIAVHEGDTVDSNQLLVVIEELL